MSENCFHAVQHNMKAASAVKKLFFVILSEAKNLFQK